MVKTEQGEERDGTNVGDVVGTPAGGSDRDGIDTKMEEALRAIIMSPYSTCLHSGWRSDGGRRAGMDDIDDDELPKRLLFTTVYATIGRLYRHNGRFHVSRQEWWSDNDDKRLPFFERTGSPDPEDFEEVTESEASKWLDTYAMRHTDLESLADDIAEVDRMEARAEQDRLARLFGTRNLFGEDATTHDAPPEEADERCCGCRLPPGTCCLRPRGRPDQSEAGGSQEKGEPK